MKATVDDALRRLSDTGVYVLGIAMSLLVLYYAQTLFLVRDRHANFVLGLSLGIYYLVQVRESLDGDTDETEVVDDPDAVSTWQFLPPQLLSVVRSVGETTAAARSAVEDRLGGWAGLVAPLWFLTLAVVSLVLMVYLDLNFTRIQEDAVITGFSTADYVFGTAIIVLSVDVTRRAFGNVLGGVIVLAVAYALAGPVFPGVLYHSGMGAQQVVRAGVLSLSGIYGFILEVGATWVAVFLLLAGFAKAYEILDWVMDASQELGKLSRTGIVHIAVASSMVMGMITGSGAANTATTGTFTIPMMKKQGVSPSFAGAVEAIASIGGQLIPPIMGIAAFLMADLLGLPYVEIIRAGVIPAFLFYFSIVVSIQILVFKHGWTSTSSESPDWRVFLEGAYYMPPFVVLIYTLIFLRYTPLTAGLYTVVTVVLTIAAREVLKDRVDGARSALRNTVEGLRQGAVDMAPLMVILASIGLAIEMFIRTGFAQKLSTLMVSLSGTNLFVLLFLAMVVSLFFGMGMPAPAAYILTASLAATAMVRLGIRDLAAHMFVFYFAMYASLTPPVGPSTVVAANIAEADFVATARRAMQLAIPGFVIPYAFVANDTLIYWAFPATLVMLAIAIVCVTGLIVALAGHDGRNAISVPRRGAYFALSLLGFFGLPASLPVPNLFGPYTVQAAASFLLLVAMVVSYQRLVQFRGSPAGADVRGD